MATHQALPQRDHYRDEAISLADISPLQGPQDLGEDPTVDGGTRSPSPIFTPLAQSLRSRNSTDAEPTRLKRSTPKKNIASGWWWWEISAALLSVTSMCLIIVVLVVVQDKPLENWKLPIQPNSLIAVLTTVGKTAMMLVVAEAISELKWLHFRQTPNPLEHFQAFDKASRGPWGSAILLWRTKAKTLLASSGALITIVALGIEPSAQQILDFPLRHTVAQNVTASVGKADHYFSKAFQEIGISTVVTRNPDILRFQTALVNGVASSVFQPQFSCPVPAFDCNWDNFKSLAVCGTCQDVTKITITNCTDKYLPTIICNYDFPGNQLGEALQMMYDPQNMENSNESMLFTSAPTLNYKGIVTVKALTDFVGGGSNASQDAPPVQVQSCSWDWCVQTYHNATATPAGVNVTSTSSEYLWFKNSTGGPTISNLVENSTGTVYQVNFNTNTLMWKVVTDSLRATVIKPRSRQQRTATVNATIDFGDFLYKSNLTQVAEDIAATLTNQIRSNNPGDNFNATGVTGRAFIKETYVRVRWPWLILPLIETLLTSVLLISSIFLSSGQPLWKSSAIAPLMVGLQGWSDAELDISGQEPLGTLDKLTKGMSVVLDRSEGGYMKLIRT